MDNMASVALSIQSTSHFPPPLPFSKKIKQKKPFLSFTEIADKSNPFRSLQLTVWSITYDGKKRGGRPAMRATKGGESELSSDSNKSSNSSDQEEIIALFRRIRSSISKAKSGNAKTKNLSSSKDKSAAASTLDVLHEPRKNVPGTGSKKGGKTSRWRLGVPKKTKRMGVKTVAAPPDFKLSRLPSNFVKRSPIPYPTPPRLMLRPPSNFVKRSPIPYPTIQRSTNLEQEIDAVTNDQGLDSADIEKMKLPELKEIAKARGIKGYSRLKKKELVHLLCSKT